MPRSHGFDWTDDRVALLAQCWAAGMKSYEIAQELGFTDLKAGKNAVDGQVLRLRRAAKLRGSEAERLLWTRLKRSGPPKQTVAMKDSEPTINDVAPGVSRVRIIKEARKRFEEDWNLRMQQCLKNN